MLHKVLVILHLLGAAVWLGGHVVLVRVVLPAAIRERDPKRILEFERGYGRIGLMALVIQLATGVWLASFWMGGWRNIVSQPTPASRLVLAKLVLLAATLALAGHAYHRVLPRLEAERMRSFVFHAWGTTVLAACMLIVGAWIRLGGPG